MSLFVTLFIVSVVFFAWIFSTWKIRAVEYRYAQFCLEKESELLRRLVESIDAYQNKIATDLHDDIGPLLSVLRIRHGELSGAVQADEELNNSYLAQIEVMETIAQKMRDTCYNLSSNVLLKSGLEAALRQFVLSLEGEHSFELNGFGQPTPKVSDSWEISMYRVITELINNALKYSGAHHFQLSKIVHEGKLIYRLAYENGVGLTNETYYSFAESGKSIGLNSIRDRLAYMRSGINFQVTGKVSSVEIEYQIENNEN